MNFILFLFMINSVFAGFQLDNEIVGEPTIECNPDHIQFSFNTRNTFKGNVYIRGHFDHQSCRRRYTTSSTQGGTLSIRIGDCGMTRMRQLMPRGVSQHITIVANFHPIFSTKEDRAFDVRCFYAHADSLVKTDLDVGVVPSETLEQATAAVPKCEYSLREGSLDGRRISSTMVGVPIFHRWDCDSNANYGILIRSCSIVDPRVTESVPFMDENGCSISRDIPQVVYSQSLTSAYMVLEAISFIDRASISFACQVQICDKTSDECRGISPPLCTNVQQMSIREQQQMIIDNHISEAIDDIGIEPWMKEHPLDPENDTTTTSTTTTTTRMPTIKILEKNTILQVDTNQTPMPRLMEISSNDDEWAIDTNQMHRPEIREKRLADNVIDVISNELFVRQLPLKMSPEPLIMSTCISAETLYWSAAALISIFTMSLGIVIYLGGHFAKRRKEIEESAVSEASDVAYYINKF